MHRQLTGCIEASQSVNRHTVHRQLSLQNRHNPGCMLIFCPVTLHGQQCGSLEYTLPHTCLLTASLQPARERVNPLKVNRRIRQLLSCL